MLFLLAGIAFRPADAAPWPYFALLLLACAAAGLRSSRPSLALGMGLPAAAAAMIGGPNLVLITLGMDLVYSAILYGGARLRLVTLILSGAGALGSGVLVLLLTRDPLGAGQTLLQVGALLLLPLSWGWMMHTRDLRIIAEREHGREALRLAELERAAREAEHRAETARDLHDLVANQVAIITLHSEAAALRLAAGHPVSERTLNEISTAGTLALGRLGEMIALLGEATPDSPGVEWIDDPRLAVPAPVRAAWEALIGQLSPDQRTQAGRLLGEATANALRHGHSPRVSIHGATVRLENRIPDSNTVSGDGRGLKNMRERAARLGGELSVGPGTTDGTWLCALTLPRRREG